MEKFVPSFTEHSLLEKKGLSRKSEKESIDSKYAEYREKINKRKQEIEDIAESDDSASRKSVRTKIKRVEIQILEHELAIAKLRDENLKHKKELKELKD